MAIERAEIERLAKDRDDEKAILERSFYSAPARAAAERQGRAGGLKGMKAGTEITDEVLDEYTPGQLAPDRACRTTRRWPRSRR